MIGLHHGGGATCRKHQIRKIRKVLVMWLMGKIANMTAETHDLTTSMDVFPYKGWGYKTNDHLPEILEILLLRWKGDGTKLVLKGLDQMMHQLWKIRKFPMMWLMAKIANMMAKTYLTRSIDVFPIIFKMFWRFYYLDRGGRRYKTSSKRPGCGS